MSYTTFNQSNHDATKEPMFFGRDVGISRYDLQKYPIFEKLIEKQLSFFWRPEEVDVTKDRIDFNKLPEHEKHIFVSNLKYQILLDSVQGRGPNMAFLPVVSIPELETWTEVWGFSECLIEGTEILTTDGWKKIHELSDVDKVAQYDNGKISFVVPSAIIRKQHDGKIFKFKSSVDAQFEQHVTPKHRMPFVKRKKGGVDSELEFAYAENYDYKSSHKAPVSGVLEGNTVLTPQERLAIATQADGTISDRYNGSRCGTIPVWFSFSKERKINRLLKLVNDCGFSIIELTGDNGSGNKKPQRRFKVNVPVDEAPTTWKSFDWLDINSLSAYKGRQFLKELSEWDSTKHDVNTKSFTYCTTSKKNADLVQAVASVSGYTARMRVRVDNRSEKFSDTYALYITPKQYKDGQSIIKTTYDYSGMVYCVTVPAGAFVCRYNNTVSISGNCIHSRSYTHIIRNIFNNPSEVFDEIVTNERIVDRAVALTKYYDDFIRQVQVYQVLGYGNHLKKGVPIEVTKYSLMKALYLVLAAVNVLEGIRFYVSFACSFAFAERKLMEGNAKIIRHVARDEALHLVGTQQMMNLIRNGSEGDEFRQVAKDCESEVYDIFAQAVQQEKEWAEYLFKDGSMIGLNKTILSQYIDHIADKRMSAINLVSPTGPVVNPIPWMSNWLESSNLQVAPQETEISSYLVGQIDSSVSAETLGGFKL